MAWFRKERKRRRAQKDRLEIPPDAWDKCERCGHVDLTESFDRVLQVCPECGYHRRIGAHRYIEIIADPDSFVELFNNLTPNVGFHFFFPSSDPVDPPQREPG